MKTQKGLSISRDLWRNFCATLFRWSTLFTNLTSASLEAEFSRSCSATISSSGSGGSPDPNQLIITLIRSLVINCSVPGPKSLIPDLDPDPGYGSFCKLEMVKNMLSILVNMKTEMNWNLQFLKFFMYYYCVCNYEIFGHLLLNFKRYLLVLSEKGADPYPWDQILADQDLEHW